MAGVVTSAQGALVAWLEYLNGERRASPRTVEAYQDCVSPYLAFLEQHRAETLSLAVMGEITATNLEILRNADAILQQEMLMSGLYYKVWQSFCVFLPVKTVGVFGDERTYDYVIALRIVESVDAMTADWAKIPHDVLQKISSRITNEVRGVSRVVLDISSKPPATIEWE